MFASWHRPQVTLRAGSSAKGIESVWDGLVKDCETSLVRNMAPDEVCPAAPSVATKTMKVGKKWKKRLEDWRIFQAKWKV